MAEYGYLYFIQGDTEEPIKVGLAENPERRLSELQTAHWKELRILAVIRSLCPVADEGALHLVLRDHRVCREWFAPAPEVRSLVAEAKNLERFTMTPRLTRLASRSSRREWVAEQARWMIDGALARAEAARLRAEAMAPPAPAERRLRLVAS